MKRLPIAVQLWSVRHHMQEDVPSTLAAVANMGFDGIEFAGYFGYEAQQLREMCSDVGLRVAGAHVQLDAVMGDTLHATAEYAVELGNSYIVVANSPNEYRSSLEGWRQVADILTAAAEVVTELGLHLGYHNHLAEFQPIEGQMPWDVILEATSELVFGQLNIAEVYRAEVDPVLYLKKYPGRALTVHVTDFGEGKYYETIGEGVGDWDAILPLCEGTAGTEWYIVEQAEEPDEEMGAVEKCLVNLRAMGR